MLLLKIFIITLFLIIFAQAIFEETVKYKSCYDIASWGSLFDEQKKILNCDKLNKLNEFNSKYRAFVTEKIVEKSFSLKKTKKDPKSLIFLKYWINSV